MGAASYAISIPLSILPAVALLWLFRRIDRARPEPRQALYVTAALGALASVPAVGLEWLAHRALGDASLLGGRFLDAFIVVALTEEALKLLVVLAYAFRQPSFDEVIDGVVYTAAASLGFGLVENVAYAASDAETGVLRAITAMPMHAIASGVMGYFVGRARYAARSATLPLALSGLFFAVLIHGVYDWAVFNHDGFWMLESAAVIVLAAGALALLVRHALRLDDAMLGRMSLTAALDAAWPTDVSVTQTLVPLPAPRAVPASIEPADAQGPERTQRKPTS